MAHLLTDCIYLLQKAWSEIKYTDTNKAILQNNIRELLDEIESDKNNKELSLDSYRALSAILIKKISGRHIACRFTCRNLYESLVMLLNSNYEKYNMLDTGNAVGYLNEAFPMYKRLCGGNISLNLRNKKDETISKQLKTDNILNRLEKDIEGIHILISIDNYKKVLDGEVSYDMIPVAIKGYYEVQIVCNGLCIKGMKINNKLGLRVINNKTGKELKANNYSDVKRIMNRA